MEKPWGILEGIRPVKLIRKLIEEGHPHPRDFFVQEYNVSQNKADLAYEVALEELNVLKQLPKNAIGLYVSIPFCKTRCLYCSFVTTASGPKAPLLGEYLKYLKKEISYTARIIESLQLNVSVIYIGGGTPTYLSAEQLQDLILHIKKYFKNPIEFTVEAGRPDSLDRVKLQTLHDLNVDRLCINPQTMNDVVLNNIGRPHSSQDIIDSFNMAKEVGFSNINMDLIVGLPGDTLGSFSETLDKVIELSPSNITVHVLSSKRGSRLSEQPISFTVSDSVSASRMSSLAARILPVHGYKAYYLYRQQRMLGNLENVGYAQPNCASLYNIIMMEETASVIAVGAGAVTRINIDDYIERIFNFKEPKFYINNFPEILNRKDKIINLFNLH